MTPATSKLDQALLDISSSFGAGSIMRLGTRPAEPVDAISTGSPSLDQALGIGGLPRGRLVEVFGPEGSGKTTICQHIVANAQRMGLDAAYVDVEHSLDPAYAARIGVDVDSLVFSQPDTGEQALEIVQRLVDSVGVIVVDSVAALAPRAELEGEAGEAHVGLQARLMAQACRRLVGPAKRSETLVLFVNQLRSSIGQMFGPSEVQPGGRALKYASAVRLDVRRIETIKHKDQAVAQRVRVRVVKNKCAAPHRTAEFVIRFGQGIDSAPEQLEQRVLEGSVKQSGSWFVFEDGTKEHGQEAAQERIRHENQTQHQ
jgi:recombination protein RecA